MQQINEMDTTIALLMPKLAAHLQQNKQRLMTAESCTGGMIGSYCTALAGSSDWFFGGLISYDNLAKENMLKVSPKDLQTHGAVSSQVVAQMCAGALAYGADISVAVSGVAGPGGGSEEKPVGTVYIGWLTQTDLAQGKAAKVQKFLFEGDRESVRKQTLLQAVQGILQL